MAGPRAHQGDDSSAPVHGDSRTYSVGPIAHPVGSGSPIR